MPNESLIPKRVEPRKYVKIVVTPLESALIKRLRQYPYGKFIVVKQAGEPKRVEILGSDQLKESEGLAFEIENKEYEAQIIKNGVDIVDFTENVDNEENGGE